jgi:predicted ATP-dependent serine protease
MKANERLEAVLKATPSELRAHYRSLLEDEQTETPEFFTVSELYSLVEDEPKPVIRSTGWSDLDRVAAGGFAVGEVILLASQAGAGKTHFAVNLAHNFARRGLKVFYLTMEDGWRMIIDRFRKIDPEGTSKSNVFMIREDELTLQNALSTLQKATLDADLIVIDNLFALPLRQNSKGDYWLSQAEWVDDLCNLIRSSQCSGLILHHLNKAPNGSSAERYQIAGSTRIVNRVSQAWLLARTNDEPQVCAIKVEKNRRSPTKGECYLKSNDQGLLFGLMQGEVNPQLVQYVQDTFSVEV